MEAITPALSAIDVLNGTKCDGIELTKNLFKDHKMSIDGNKKQRLETYLRIRSIPNLDTNDRKNCYQVSDSNTLLVIPPKGSNANKFNSENERKKYNFSKIFEEKANQSLVYECCALPIVKRFLSGQNGLLFAYGITSSGKSYTMRGTTTNPGVIPRSLQTVFEVINHKIVGEVPQLKPSSFTNCEILSEEERVLEEEVRTFIFNQSDESYEMKQKMDSFRSQISNINENSSDSLLWDEVLHSTFRAIDSNIRCSVWISFYEIYNETIYDLLELIIAGQKKQKILLIKDESENYYVKGLRQIFVSSAEEAYKVLLFGQNNLHISSTNLNKNSSRSHCAFSITLVSTFNNSHNRKSLINMNHLSICDLAGAERSQKANNTGERLKEAGKINGSLLSLSRCISALRHNQKFEHDSSKQRFVNYRDSKLTKVFQPFLSGSGTTAMISTMNPSPNLFDETLFALKFTGVAAQIIISTEDQRNKLHDSLKRLTQVWMQSSERWSTYALLKPPKPSVSIIQTIPEEEEDDSEGDNQSLDMTVEQIERRVEEITQMDLSRADPQDIEMMRTQIEFLVEKLKQTETDKFDMEIEVRKQVVSEFDKLFKDMQEMAEDKDRAKKKLEEMMAQRLTTTENLHKQERLELENKLSSIETENFRINEKVCQLKEETQHLTQVIEQKDQMIGEKDETIKRLESQLSQHSSEKLKNETKEYKDMMCSPIKANVNESSTSTSPINLIDANVSAINLVELKDANTSAIDMSTQLTSPKVELSDKGVGNCFPELQDSETSTTNFNEMIDKNTSVSIEWSNKSTITQIDCFEDKQTETDSMTCSPSETTLIDRCVSTIKVESVNASTSPLVSNPSSDCSETLVSNKKMQELMESLHKYENDVKVLNARIECLHKSEGNCLQKIQVLEEDKNKLEEKLKSKDDFSLRQLKDIYHSSKPSSVASSSVSFSSFGSKGDDFKDTNSVVSVDSLTDKTKKTSKYSSRKRKPNVNSSDKRYLSNICSAEDKLETTIDEKCSQTSVKSTDSCFADEVGNEVFSTKKQSNRKIKRKANNYENEDVNKGPPYSKRKRPPLKNLYESPLSPIPTGERVTRSRARKCIDFNN